MICVAWGDVSPHINSPSRQARGTAHEQLEPAEGSAFREILQLRLLGQTALGFIASRWGFTLWWTYKKQRKMAIEIVDFPIEHGDFP